MYYQEIEKIIKVVNKEKSYIESNKDYKESKEKMKEIVVKIKTKAGENGKTFGSITSKEISENLEKQFKIKVDKKKISLPEQIKTLGTYIVDVKLFEGVVGKLTVVVTE